MLIPETHLYKGIITGKIRRSVTTVLAEEGWIDKRWYREGFQDIGTQGHKLLDAFDKGLKFRAPDIYLRYLVPYQAFLKHTRAKVIDSEVELENILLSYCGQLDKIIEIPGHGVGIMDVKFSQCGFLPWHDLQTEAYRQALLWHPKYKGLEIKWRGGIIIGPDCQLPKLIPHDRIPDVNKIWQSIAISNLAKHQFKVQLEEVTQSEGWW